MSHDHDFSPSYFFIEDFFPPSYILESELLLTLLYYFVLKCKSF
jgi:hypothetical protein